jgi:hypothetical protein
VAGEVLPLGGRFWLVERIEETQGETGLPRIVYSPEIVVRTVRARRFRLTATKGRETMAGGEH